MKNAIRAGTRKFNEGCRRAYRRRNRPVEIARQVHILVRSARDACRYERSRQTLKHLRAIKREWLRAKESRAGRVEDVHAHVISIRPYAQVRIIEEVRTEVKSVTVITAGSIAAG